MLEIIRPGALLEVRSWLPEHKAGAKPVTLDGRELPREVGVTFAGHVRVLCLAPGEWLLVSDQNPAVRINEQVGADLREQGAVLVDTTGSLGVLSLRGPVARDVLSKGCGLDFHPSAFPVGRCARTRFAQMSVIIDHVDEAPTFHCYVGKSYLTFLADWIEDAAVEFASSSRIVSPLRHR